MFYSLSSHGLQTTRFFCPWNSAGMNTGVDCETLLQGNLPHPGIKPVVSMARALEGGFLTITPPGKRGSFAECDLIFGHF